MTSSYARSSPQSSSSPRRPFCIAELADRATHNLWDPSKGLKQWLKAADGFRKAGRAYHEAGDFEAAFVEFAKAATIILEKLPSHKEYFTLLTATQRHNLGLVSPQYIPSCPFLSSVSRLAIRWMDAVLGCCSRLGVSCTHYVLSRLCELALICPPHRTVKTSSPTSVK
jgi:hypothetical protein